MTRYLLVISRESFAAELEAAGITTIDQWAEKIFEDEHVLISWIGEVTGLDHLRVNVLEKNGFSVELASFASIVEERFPSVPIEVFALF